MTYNTTITSKGQVTIPADIRRNLDLKAGESVRFKLGKDNQVVIEKNDWKRGLNKLQGEVAAHLKKHNIKPLSDQELDEAINESAQQAATEQYKRSLE
ncbi:MAG TPA: AbrB/MazE/SpoVT family DNA-binding domain-containing protein [Candidatus Saccharimonadales bacterium]|nr:AbrB/MazE/SpoVT family DNA-binding domain-containing protein [Candidatus Saccharimonadales bacterium]